MIAICVCRNTKQQIMNEIKKSDNGGPAFPSSEVHGQQFVDTPMGKGFEQGYEDAQHGMSLRDYFAGKAMLGVLTSNDDIKPFLVNEANSRCGRLEDEVANFAYRQADAMLRARKQL